MKGEERSEIRAAPVRPPSGPPQVELIAMADREPPLRLSHERKPTRWYEAAVLRRTADRLNG